MSLRKPLACLLTACVVLFSVSLSGNAIAYERTSSVTAGGKTASKTVNAAKTDEGYTRSATTTGPNDKAVTKQSSGSWDSSTKTWTKNKAVTGPKGQSKSWEKETSVSK